MLGKRAAVALALVAGALALGVGAAVAAEDNREYSTPATADGVEHRLAPPMPSERVQDGRDQ
jgi:hypothetical protein